MKRFVNFGNYDFFKNKGQQGKGLTDTVLKYLLTLFFVKAMKIICIIAFS